MQGSKNLAIMFLLGALLVGGALGFAADRYAVKDRLCAPKLSESQLRQAFYKDLDLNAEQRARWDALLDERQRAMSAARATIRPRQDSIMENYRLRTTELLTPEQRARLEERRREDRAREERAREERRQQQQNDDKNNGKNDRL
jgi:Spy/CpxP family protein refolding chaperone